MKRKRKRVIATLAVVFLVLVCAGLYLAAAWPATGPERIVVSSSIVGVLSGDTHAYIIHNREDLVLINAGSDPTAAAIVAELDTMQLAPENVHAILLTDGHREHWRGAERFPNAAVIVGSEDQLQIRGEKKPRAPLRKLLVSIANRLDGRPPVPRHIRTALPGARLQLGNLIFDVVAIPGYTAGSLMFVHDGVLFSGDSLLVRSDEVLAPPWFLSHRPKDTRDALHRLEKVAFSQLADARGGFDTDGREGLERLLAEHRQ